MNTVPPITDPLGQHWEQPNPANILIDDTHALMSNADFEKLHDYSHSMPTGVYPGKMWKRRTVVLTVGGKIAQWYLGWFGVSEDPKYCSNNWRKILIA